MSGVLFEEKNNIDFTHAVQHHNAMWTFILYTILYYESSTFIDSGPSKLFEIVSDAYNSHVCDGNSHLEMLF